MCLHERLTNKVAGSAMGAPVADQVTLRSRFHERLCDHALNLARRIQTFPTRLDMPESDEQRNTVSSLHRVGGSQMPAVDAVDEGSSQP